MKKTAANARASRLFAAVLLVLLLSPCGGARAFVPDIGAVKPDFGSGEWTTGEPSVTGAFDISKTTPPDGVPAVSPAGKPAPPGSQEQKPPAKKPSLIEEEPGTAPPQAPPQAEEAVKKQQQKKKSDVSLSGYRYVRMRNYSSTGNKSRFESQEGLYTRGSKLEQGTDMNVVAKTGNTGLTGSFMELPQQEREMDFKLSSGLWEASFGDLTVNFKGGEFSPFSKRITGFEFGYGTKALNVQLITSQSKSQTKTTSFSGRNIKGPYDLGATDLIPESITVRLNNVPMTQGQYILDAFLGQLTFYDVLGPNDVVTVAYEQRLRGGLSAGNIMGVSASYGKERWSVGFSHLIEQANRSSESVQKSVAGETATLNGSVLSVQYDFIARTRDKGSETITMTSGSTEKVLEAGVDYNAGLTEAEVMENYRYGRFILASPDPSATYKVSYSYFPETGDIIQRQQKEFLSPIGGIATLQKQTVYYGSEDVYVCTDVTLETTRFKLRRGTDYEIDETLNRITLYAYQDEPYLRIDYWYYPSATVDATSYDHTVQDFRFDFKPSAKLGFDAEYAVSQSDISNKPIQISNETVATVAGQLDCDAGFAIAACKFNLAHPNVVRNTVTVFFNDRLLQSNILTQYTHYTLDSIRGTIELKVKIPAGTVIRADYQYTPDRDPGLATGNIWRMHSGLKLAKTAFNVTLKGADTAFTPIGSENNMETASLNWDLSHKISDALDFSADSLTTETALDLEGLANRTSDQKNYALAWKPKDKKRGLSLDVSYNTRANYDDRDPRTTDSDEKGYALNGGANMPVLKNASLTFGLSGRKYNDNTTENSGNDTKKREFGFDWKPSRKLSLTSDTSSTALTTRSTTGEFTTTNTGNSIGMTYLPTNLLTFGAKIDRQTTSDTRPDTEPQTISQEMIRFDTKPFWKVNFISVIRTRSDRPSINTPSSHSEATNFTTSFLITSALTYTPVFNVTKSSYGISSVSKSTSNTHTLAYRPPGKPYRFSYTLDNGTRSSSGASTSSSFKLTRHKYEAGYNPSPAWDFSTNIEKEKDSSSAGAADAYNVDTLNLRLRHMPNKRHTHWLSVNRVSRGGTQTNSRDILELGLDYKLTEVFRWDFSFKRSKYDDGDNSAMSYSGNIFESSLRVEF